MRLQHHWKPHQHDHVDWLESALWLFALCMLIITLLVLVTGA